MVREKPRLFMIEGTVYIVKNDRHIGERHGHFVIIGINDDLTIRTNKKHYNCLCDCGNIFTRRSEYALHPKRNGCEVCGFTRPDMIKHGLACSRFDNIRHGMIQRCYNVNNPYYKNYGARGIKVCDEWLNKENGLTNFYNWSICNGYNDDLTIDRIDNDKDYEPSNCRWVSIVEQENNRRTNRYILYNGKTKTMMQWSRLLGIKYDTLYYHFVRRGKPMEYIVSKYANHTYKGGG